MSNDDSAPLLGGTIVTTDTVESDRPVRAKQTPLPKLQSFTVFFIQLSEPVTALVVYPFIVQLVRDTGVTHGNEALTGYYAGFIVGLNSELHGSISSSAHTLRNRYSIFPRP
jgi:hypothetical protein